MQYATYYNSPLGKILIAADEIGLTGLWFEGQKYFAYTFESDYRIGDLPVLKAAKRWLDIYFSGKDPNKKPLKRVLNHLYGTPFQVAVWMSIMKIPYGTTATYGEIAKIISPKMSAQAVGNALKNNPVFNKEETWH